MKTQGKDTDVVFLSGVRTPFGTFGGTLKDFSAIDLAVEASKCAIEKSGLKPAELDHAVFGNALQTSADAIYFARHVALKAGLPIEKPALTVNRLCGSGFEAVAQGAQQILLGESQAVLVGGGESMSQAPHVLRGARWGLRLGPSAPLEDLRVRLGADPPEIHRPGCEVGATAAKPVCSRQSQSAQSAGRRATHPKLDQTSGHLR